MRLPFVRNHVHDHWQASENLCWHMDTGRGVLVEERQWSMESGDIIRAMVRLSMATDEFRQKVLQSFHNGNPPMAFGPEDLE